MHKNIFDYFAPAQAYGLAFQYISGLALNQEKSELLITSLSEALVTSLAEVMGCKAAQFPTTYLGLPLSNRKLRKQDYFPLINKIRMKLTSWNAALLSPAGRLVLVNSCLTSMPLFFMSGFQIPKWTIKEIDKIRMKFFWHGTAGHTKRLIMVPWDTICTLKMQGGLGILNLIDMNKALLARWLWYWTSSKERLWSCLAATLQNNHTSLMPEFSPLKDFPAPIYPCCGAPGRPYNFSLNMQCGTKGSQSCPNPARYISWDGTHLIDAANQIIANGILYGPYALPPL